MDLSNIYFIDIFHMTKWNLSYKQHSHTCIQAFTHIHQQEGDHSKQALQYMHIYIYIYMPINSLVHFVRHKNKNRAP